MYSKQIIVQNMLQMLNNAGYNSTKMISDYLVTVATATRNRWKSDSISNMYKLILKYPLHLVL